MTLECPNGVLPVCNTGVKLRLDPRRREIGARMGHGVEPRFGPKTRGSGVKSQRDLQRRATAGIDPRVELLSHIDPEGRAFSHPSLAEESDGRDGTIPPSRRFRLGHG